MPINYSPLFMYHCTPNNTAPLLMGVDMPKNHPHTSTHTKDYFASPALSLSLAGIFRHAGPAASVDEVAMEVEEGDEGSGGAKRDDAVEISSENSGPASRSKSDDEFDAEGDEEDGDGDHKNKKRKKYHRHTAEQIREMEALFKESPHPDEKQRQQLSKQLGLHPRQVKFWFQNRRTQIKAIQERHENSLLKSELDKLREENKTMRETINKSCCPNCGTNATIGRGAAANSEDQQLRIENAKLKAEVEKLRSALVRCPQGTASSPSSSAGNGQEHRSSLDYYSGIFGIEKTKIIELVHQAKDELIKMATAGEPLWIRSVETGREILNYDEYTKEFNTFESSSKQKPKRSIEASRETGVVLADLPQLVQCFMDVNHWKEMFPCSISKASTVDVICNGDGANRNGGVQLMVAELQMLTPMVPTREVYFVRYCKQLNTQQWAIVDVSIDKVEDDIDASLVKCRKRPSGCIIEDKSNGHCKVTWVEHLECQKSNLHTMYRTIVNSGLAFGARHWMATLQVQCERHMFSMATYVPLKDSNGVATLAGRKSILKLAQRMTWVFCHAIGSSSYHNWTRISSRTGEDVRICSRKNLNDPGEPTGVILSAVSSVWLPVSPQVLFDFLRDEAHRSEWDIMSSGGKVQSVANLAKGQDRGNAVAIQSIQSKENRIWILQDSYTNSYEYMVVYAPVDITGMKSVMTGCDSSNIAILPSGFSILPDGIESRPLVISSRQEERNIEGGSLLTLAVQICTSSSPSSKSTKESVESINTVISCILKNIKTCLQCEDN